MLTQRTLKEMRLRAVVIALSGVTAALVVVVLLVRYNWQYKEIKPSLLNPPAIALSAPLRPDPREVAIQKIANRTNDLTGRIALLNKKHSDGLISDEDFRSKSNLLMDEAEKTLAQSSRELEVIVKGMMPPGFESQTDAGVGMVMGDQGTRYDFNPKSVHPVGPLDAGTSKP